MMKKYMHFFNIRFLYGLQYRAAAYAGVATQFAWGAMTILIFQAFYQTNAHAFPMSFHALTDYVWLQQAFLALYMSWYFDQDIMQSVVSGQIAYELCRPLDLYSMWFVKNMATRMARAVLRCMPILMIVVFLPQPYRLSAPSSLTVGLLFIVSMLIGFCVLVAFTMFIYIAAFYTVSPRGIQSLSTTAVEFLSGAVIPIPFFPSSIQSALWLLPFASIQNTPFLIYNGYIDRHQIHMYLMVQIIWLLILVGLGRWWMKRAVKKVTAHGG